MESTQIDHTNTLLLTHLTDSHPIGKLTYKTENKNSQLIFVLENISDHRIQEGLQALEEYTKELHFAKPGYIKEKRNNTITITFVYPEEIVLILYILNLNPALIHKLSPEAKIPFQGIKRKSAKWLKEIIQKHQIALENHCQKHHSPQLFQALVNYASQLENKTYTIFLRQLLKETHTLMVDAINLNQRNLLHDLHTQKNKLTHSLFISKRGVNYLIDNLEKKSNLGLRAIINGYFKFYTHPLIRWLPTALHQMLRSALKLQNKLEKIFDQLREIDSELHTQIRESETGHHLNILINETRQLNHQLKTQYAQLTKQP